MLAENRAEKTGISAPAQPPSTRSGARRLPFLALLAPYLELGTGDGALAPRADGAASLAPPRTCGRRARSRLVGLTVGGRRGCGDSAPRGWGRGHRRARGAGAGLRAPPRGTPGRRRPSHDGRQQQERGLQKMPERYFQHRWLQLHHR